MRIFVMGGTGLVGTRLLKHLLERKDEIVLLTRRPDFARERWGSSCTIVEGDPMVAGPWQDQAGTCEAVVNLVGEGVFNRRWNNRFKTLLRDSRVKTTQHLVQGLQRPGSKAKVLVNASAIGYYGAHGEEELDEEGAPGADFLAQLCIYWEKAALGAESAGVRVVVLRVGVVLDQQGGALRQMLLPFRLFLGGPIASGRQYVSWIHHQDMVGLILLALDNPQARGPLNATAPNPVTNRDFAKALGKVLGRPSSMPTPGFALRLLLGEVADVVTKGQRVIPKKALALGYPFHFPEIQTALADVVGKVS